LSRLRAVLAVLALALVAALGGGAPAAPAVALAAPTSSTTRLAPATVHPGPHDDGPHPPLLPPAPATVRPRHAAGPRTVQALTGGGVQISGLDLHDSTVTRLDDGRYAMYGTMYGCGYQWYVQNTPWCGFGVSTAATLSGPWSTPTQLFSPSDIDPWSGLTWSHECGDTGQGCFNPRMIRRDTWGSADGVFILWFNSPIDYSRNHANAYNAMGCNGPLGPCGPGAGAPHGSYSKPSLGVCAGNGDLGVITSGTPGQAPAIVCTMPGATQLNLEQLNQWGVGGTGTGVRAVAGVANAESPGGWYDQATGAYVLTYSDPGCGYCTGSQTGYATAPSLYTGWTTPANLGFGMPANGRRAISANSCGGQPRTVSILDGEPWQVIDTWTGDRNETSADTILTPLDYGPATGTPGDGGLWTPPVSYTC